MFLFKQTSLQKNLNPGSFAWEVTLSNGNQENKYLLVKQNE